MNEIGKNEEQRSYANIIIITTNLNGVSIIQDAFSSQSLRCYCPGPSRMSKSINRATCGIFKVTQVTVLLQLEGAEGPQRTRYISSFKESVISDSFTN